MLIACRTVPLPHKLDLMRRTSKADCCGTDIAISAGSAVAEALGLWVKLTEVDRWQRPLLCEVERQLPPLGCEVFHLFHASQVCHDVIDSLDYGDSSAMSCNIITSPLLLHD